MIIKETGLTSRLLMVDKVKKYIYLGGVYFGNQSE